MNKRSIKLIIYIAVVICSALFIFLGNRIFSSEIPENPYQQDTRYYSAVVLNILDRFYDDQSIFTDAEIVFTARIASGIREGDFVTARQHINTRFGADEREVALGDRIVLFYDDFGDQFFFVSFIRITWVVVLGIVFFLMVLAFGRLKGFSGILALIFSCLAVFLVFIPAIMAGHNIYFMTLIISVFAIVMTLLLVVGANRKTLTALIGCFGGVLLAAILMVLMDYILALTGFVSQETMVLTVMIPGIVLDLRALVFAGVIFGAVGAIMDVAMSIASALWEVSSTRDDINFKQLVRSGMNIGRDILGTMLNTLVLAYIGSSLTIILVITAQTTHWLELFNMEMIIVEFLRALIGSFGMLITIPLTALVAGFIFPTQKPTEEDTIEETEIEYDDYFGSMMQRRQKRD